LLTRVDEAKRDEEEGTKGEGRKKTHDDGNGRWGGKGGTWLSNQYSGEAVKSGMERGAERSLSEL